MELNPLTIRHAIVTKQSSNANNIFKATALTYSSFSEATEKVPWFAFYFFRYNTGSVIPGESAKSRA